MYVRLCVLSCCIELKLGMRWGMGPEVWEYIFKVTPPKVIQRSSCSRNALWPPYLVGRTWGNFFFLIRGVSWVRKGKGGKENKGKKTRSGVRPFFFVEIGRLSLWGAPCKKNAPNLANWLWKLHFSLHFWGGTSPSRHPVPTGAAFFLFFIWAPL